MPFAVIVIVGVDVAGVGVEPVDGVGDVGAAPDPPLEQAAMEAREMTTTTIRITPDACPAEAVNRAPQADRRARRTDGNYRITIAGGW
jgi:hypothetical protein